MGKVEIKIRKKILTPDNVQQYRNYPALLKKYERNKRFRRALRIFLYSLGLTILVLALIFLGMWKVLLDKKHESSKLKKLTFLKISGNQSDTVEYTFYNQFQTDSFYVFSYQYHTLFDQQYRLPVKPEFSEVTINEKITCERMKIIRVNGQDYTILRYLITHPGTDSDVFMFYSPDFGLLYIGPKKQRGYSRLIGTGNIKDDSIINQLTQDIENDESFFTGRNL